MNKPLPWLVGSLGLIAALLAVLMYDPDPNGTEEIRLYCAAGIKKPVEALAREYEAECGVRVDIQYGGSGTLLANIEVAGRGDLYLAADESYIKLARGKGLVAEALPLAHIKPVIAIPYENPKRIKGFEDLKRPDVRVALANPDAAAIGRIVRKILAEEWSELEQKAKVLKPTVNELAMDVAIGAVDAAIVWDATVMHYEDLDLIEVPRLNEGRQKVTVGVLKSTGNPAAALRFARFISSRNRGLPRFSEFGFEGINGDLWEARPNLLLFSGAMLRPGVEETIKAFERREGVSIDRVYNGCGILVAQMKSGAEPEAYFSCDVKFMDMVEDRFCESKVITENDIVIAVAKGNPKEIARLSDLTREGLKVGIGHPDKSALGYLTRLMLDQAGIALNPVVESATGDFLINQILVGGLDAVIVYRSNVMATPENPEEHLDIVNIDRKDAKAAQPWAIARNSEHPMLLGRLFDAIAASREQFESVGFHWQLDD